MFPWQPATTLEPASLEGILQLLSGGRGERENRGKEKEKRGKERGRRKEKGYGTGEGVKTHQIGTDTKQPKKYINIFHNQRDFGGPFCYDYFLFLSLFLFFTLDFPAPWLFSICFISTKVPFGISINQHSQVFSLSFLTFNI